jgi:hypothetical protein
MVVEVKTWWVPVSIPLNATDVLRDNQIGSGACGDVSSRIPSHFTILRMD